MTEAIIDTIIDSVKLLPFLFLTYLLMEYLEDRMTEKTKKILKDSGKTGPLWGALLGMVPQCGFSAAASNLYTGRIITMGTLLAIYLSTSDEMLPILISEAVSPILIIKILFIKVAIGMTVGFLIDIIYEQVLKKNREEPDIHHFCEHEHCHCGEGIMKPAIRHTLQIFFFILLISLCLNLIIEFMGTDVLANFILNKPIIGEMLAGIIGLIPNCAASVVITQLYLDGILPFGTMMAGLLVSSGIGM
ncbi:MAG: putative manganese transporter, partial [Lachnospiraceae bacterium]|nr:putative manganese transporter [Lachnospiraceae bacterium]